MNRYFLGGQDLEMAEIRTLLERHAPGQIVDRHLPWGARYSDYQAEIVQTLSTGQTPVLIELRDDLPPDLFDRSRVIVVDHHDNRAGADQPTSLEQIFDLLRLPKSAWTRHHEMVAANDRAHVAGLRAVGASYAEIAAIRAADRAAQGVTEDDEREAKRAIAARRTEGAVTVVSTTSHTSSAIADRMLPEAGGPGYGRLLVIMPEKLAVFADGPAIAMLAERYPQSWWGGNLPHSGFWGIERRTAELNLESEVIACLR